MAEYIPLLPDATLAAKADHNCSAQRTADAACEHLCPCESVWTCTRGRTRLCCELQEVGDGRCQLTLMRNTRQYGKYDFAGRDSALVFAARLRHTFSGNGWMSA